MSLQDISACLASAAEELAAVVARQPFQSNSPTPTEKGRTSPPEVPANPKS